MTGRKRGGRERGGDRRGEREGGGGGEREGMGERKKGGEREERGGEREEKGRESRGGEREGRGEGEREREGGRKREGRGGERGGKEGGGGLGVRREGDRSMCSLVVSVLDSPTVDPRSNPGTGSALLMILHLQLYYISSCHMLIDKALSSDKPTGHWFEADWPDCKCDALSSNRKVDGSRLTGSTEACHS